jgi:hypothetical protein
METVVEKNVLRPDCYVVEMTEKLDRRMEFLLKH